MNRQLSFLLIFFTIVLVGILGLLADQARESINLHLNIRNNLWAHYNFKSLKSKLYEVEKNRLAFTLQAFNTGKVTNQEAQTLLSILTSNLDREIARYKKEQADLQAEAVRYDTSFEIAKRRYLVFSIGFLLSICGFFSLLFHFLLHLKLWWPKLLIGTMFLLAIGAGIYGLLLM